MAFKLSKVVPWGRTFHEYVEMFRLSGKDLSKKIIIEVTSYKFLKNGN